MVSISNANLDCFADGRFAGGLANAVPAKVTSQAARSRRTLVQTLHAEAIGEAPNASADGGLEEWDETGTMSQSHL